jgi:(1->4)-alpha-D-glucan 1-alpha-D-glucosylmutase
MKFQQYTGPVMAKGLEDTFFYRYNRLLSLNEVGGNPKCFGISVAAFHRTNQTRLRYWPHSMLNTSTHDSKRSEDVRARINVLSEMATEWQKRIKLWSVQNRSYKSKLDDNNPAPSKNDEYAFYQNLLGAWPLVPLDEQTRGKWIDRMKNMALKTSRESKTLTSWTNPNLPYEQALRHFVEGSLGESNNPFQNDFLSFLEDVAWFGMLNGLTQAFLKMVSPGIPDIYQGNESWRFCLVDPDSRRPVDFQQRQSMLFPLLERVQAETDLKTLQQDLLANLPDGRAKMYVIAQTLRLRNSSPDVFTEGSYLPLEVTGCMRKHICAFAREKNDQVIVVVAPRLYLTLMQGKKDLPLTDTVWQDTEVRLPKNFSGMRLQNIFSDESEHIIEPKNGHSSLAVGRVLQFWPVALLKGEVLPTEYPRKIKQ